MHTLSEMSSGRRGIMEVGEGVEFVDVPDDSPQHWHNDTLEL